MRFFNTSLALLSLSAAALTGCGGGSETDLADTGPVPGTQQYPAGVWEGTTGVGASARPVLGYIDPGADGQGGEFFFAKSAAGSAGYDALYGRLRVNVTTVLASNVTYFSVQDGKFSNGLSLRGTASANAQTGKTNLVSASYSDPVGTIAATGASTPMKLTYSALNNYPAKLSLIEGIYRGGSVFGGGWVLQISALGTVQGSIGSCTLTGNVAVRPGNSAVYGINLSVTGDEKLCPNANTSQAGVAILKFDANSLERTGIWMLTRNGSGSPTTYVLDGGADGPNSVQPAPVQQSAAGYWRGTTNTGANTAVTAVVMPDNSYFFYKRVGTGYDVLYGTLLTSAGSSVVSSNDGVYFASQSSAETQYTAGIELNGDARTGQSFTGTYVDPTAGGTTTRFDTTPDPTYLYVSPVPRNIALLEGAYQSRAVGFGGVSMDLDVNKTGALTGLSSDGCKVKATLRAYQGVQNLNFYQVQGLTYTGSCAAAGSPAQSGMASAQFDAAGTRITGLRILAAGTGPSGARASTVFLGTWLPPGSNPKPEPEPPVVVPGTGTGTGTGTGAAG